MGYFWSVYENAERLGIHDSTNRVAMTTSSQETFTRTFDAPCDTSAYYVYCDVKENWTDKTACTSSDAYYIPPHCDASCVGDVETSIDVSYNLSDNQQYMRDLTITVHGDNYTKKGRCDCMEKKGQIQIYTYYEGRLQKMSSMTVGDSSKMFSCIDGTYVCNYDLGFDYFTNDGSNMSPITSAIIYFIYGENNPSITIDDIKNGIIQNDSVCAFKEVRIGNANDINFVSAELLYDHISSTCECFYTNDELYNCPVSTTPDTSIIFIGFFITNQKNHKFTFNESECAFDYPQDSNGTCNNSDIVAKYGLKTLSDLNGISIENEVEDFIQQACTYYEDGATENDMLYLYPVFNLGSSITFYQREGNRECGTKQWHSSFMVDEPFKIKISYDEMFNTITTKIKFNFFESTEASFNKQGFKNKSTIEFNNPTLNIKSIDFSTPTNCSSSKYHLVYNYKLSLIAGYNDRL